MRPRRVTLAEPPDGLKSTFAFEYEGKRPPSAPERREALASYLEDCARRIREGKAVDIGNAQDVQRKVYRDDVLVEREEEQGT